MTGGRQPAAPEAQRIAGQQVRGAHPPLNPRLVHALSACPFLLPKKKVRTFSNLAWHSVHKSSHDELLAEQQLLAASCCCAPLSGAKKSRVGRRVFGRLHGDAARAEAPSTSRRAFRVCTMNSSMTQRRSADGRREGATKGGDDDVDAQLADGRSAQNMSAEEQAALKSAVEEEMRGTLMQRRRMRSCRPGGTRSRRRRSSAEGARISVNERRQHREHRRCHRQT